MIGSLFRRSKGQVIRDNAARGRSGEDRVKMEYEMAGYKVKRTGRGHDFKATRNNWWGGKETKYVEVKTGSSQLSPLQKKRRRSMGRKYVVERTSPHSDCILGTGFGSERSKSSGMGLFGGLDAEASKRKSRSKASKRRGRSKAAGMGLFGGLDAEASKRKSRSKASKRRGRSKAAGMGLFGGLDAEASKRKSRSKASKRRGRSKAAGMGLFGGLDAEASKRKSRSKASKRRSGSSKRSKKSGFGLL